MSLLPFLPAVLLAATSPAADARNDLACAAASDWIADFVPGLYAIPFVYSEDAQSLPEAGRKLQWKQPRSDKSAPAPSRALIDALVKAGATNAAPHCPGFTANLGQRGIESGPAAVERATKARRDAKLPEPWVGGVSMPVLSADGTEALLSVSGGQSIYQSAGLSHMRRDANGKWREVAHASLWYY